MTDRTKSTRHLFASFRHHLHVIRLRSCLVDYNIYTRIEVPFIAKR